MAPSSGYVPRGAAVVACVVCGALLPLLTLAFAGGCAAPEQGVQADAAERRADANGQRNDEAKAETDAAVLPRPHCPTPKVVSVERHKPADGAAPQLALAEEVSTAPPVWPSQQTKHTFKVSNTGKGPLHIRLKGG